MTFEHILAFNIALIAAIASPGPALLVAIQTTLRAGRKSGIAIGFGLGLMAAIWTMMALLGLETIFQLVPWAYTVTKLMGAIYLLYIAVGMWRGARDSVRTTAAPVHHAFRQGFWINVLNPKSVLFSAAVLVVIFPESMTVLDRAMIVVNHLVIEILFYTALAFGMSTSAAKNGYLRARLYIDRTASVILGALGLRLLLDR